MGGLSAGASPGISWADPGIRGVLQLQQLLLSLPLHGPGQLGQAEDLRRGSPVPGDGSRARRSGRVLPGGRWSPGFPAAPMHKARNFLELTPSEDFQGHRRTLHKPSSCRRYFLRDGMSQQGHGGGAGAPILQPAFGSCFEQYLGSQVLEALILCFALDFYQPGGPLMRNRARPAL